MTRLDSNIINQLEKLDNNLRNKGKATIQTVVPLSQFDRSGIKLTIKEFISPNGNIINGVGITPDYYVEDDIATERDLQMEKAINIIK